MVLVLLRTKTLHRFHISFLLEPCRTFGQPIPVAETSFHIEDRSGALSLEATYK
jgi:hypothetical protein